MVIMTGIMVDTMVIIIIQGETKNNIGQDCCFIVECRMLCFNCKLWNDEEMKCEEGIKEGIF